MIMLPTAVLASETPIASPPPCDVAIVIDRSTVSHTGFTGPTSLSCSSVTDLGDGHTGYCADSYAEIASSPQDSTEASMKVLRLRN